MHVLGVVRFFGARYAGMLGHKLVGFVLAIIAGSAVLGFGGSAF